MSWKTHGSVSAEVAHILAELKERGPEEVRLVYGIDVKEDGSVYDVAYDQTFGDMIGWVHFNRELDQADFDEEYTGGKYDDEDY